MNICLKLLIITLLTSCASTAYNPSFIMGDSKKIEPKNEAVTQLEIKSDRID